MRLRRLLYMCRHNQREKTAQRLAVRPHLGWAGVWGIPVRLRVSWQRMGSPDLGTQ